MKISELKNAPAWLLEAETRNADVILENGKIQWLSGDFRGDFLGGNFRGGNFLGGDFRGDFRGGNFLGGDFRGGNFLGGDFRGGNFRSGNFRGGNFWGGDFRGDFLGGDFRGGNFLGDFWGGDFCSGNFCGGNFRGGRWAGGRWRDNRIDRLMFMAARCGIVFDDEGYATAYRSTNKDYTGRYDSAFRQIVGEYYEDDAYPAGAGVCFKGVHVTDQAAALTYFGVKDSQLWRVKFKRKDLLDCDGEKARIRGGVFEPIPWPFYDPNGVK